MCKDDFRKRLRTSIEKLGGGNEFSRKTGIGRRSLENYLTGKTEPKTSILKQIAETANVSVQWLATGKELDFTEALNERANQVIEKNGGLIAFCEKSGMDTERLEYALKGMRSLTTQQMVKIANTGGVSFEWLVTGEEPLTPTQGGRSIGTDWDLIAEQFNVHPIDLIACPMIGDQMYPTIRNQENVVFSKNDKHLSIADGVFFISINGNTSIRRLQQLPNGRIRVISDNKAYDPYEVDEIDIDIQSKALCVTTREI